MRISPAVAGIALVLMLAGGVRLVTLVVAARRILSDAERTQRRLAVEQAALRAARGQQAGRARAANRPPFPAPRGSDGDEWAHHHASECVNIRCPRHAAGGVWLPDRRPGERP